MIGFVIVAEQMQDAVEDQDAHFGGEGAVVMTRVALRHGGRDSNVTEIVTQRRARW